MTYPSYYQTLEHQPNIVSFQNASSCGCYDHREPSYNTVIYGDTIKGFLPAGSYDFTENGTVINSCNGEVVPKNSLFARTAGPIMGITMGSCVPRGSQSAVLNFNSGLFNALPSTLARKCFV